MSKLTQTPRNPQEQFAFSHGVETQRAEGSKAAVTLQQRREWRTEHHTWWPGSPPVLPFPVM